MITAQNKLNRKVFQVERYNEMSRIFPFLLVTAYVASNDSATLQIVANYNKFLLSMVSGIHANRVYSAVFSNQQGSLLAQSENA